MTYENKVKYIGVFIISDLSDNIDMTRQMRSLYSRANILLRNFNKCSIDIMKTLFPSFGTNMFCRVAFSNVFRNLLGYLSVSVMFLSHNFDRFETLMRKRIFKFTERVINSKSTIINMLSSSYTVLGGSLWKQWNTRLYTLAVCLVYDKGAGHYYVTSLLNVFAILLYSNSAQVLMPHVCFSVTYFATQGLLAWNLYFMYECLCISVHASCNSGHKCVTRGVPPINIAGTSHTYELLICHHEGGS